MTDTAPRRGFRAGDIVLEDIELSLAAKGLFAVASLLGDGCSLDEIQSRTSDPPEFLMMVLDELVRAGYVQLADRTVQMRPLIAGN